MSTVNVNKLRLGQEVARELGVSVTTARQLARTDPGFPAVLVLGPRTRLVDVADLRRYIRARTISPARVIA